MFYIDFEGFYKEFHTYEEAEIYCIENHIHCENIFEDFEDYDGEGYDLETGFDPYEGCYTFDC